MGRPRLNLGCSAIAKDDDDVVVDDDDNNNNNPFFEKHKL
jgi:hypothetical protein